MDEKERQELESSIDATVEEMKKKIEEISAAADEEVADDDIKGKITALKDKTVDVLSAAIDKLKATAKDVKDSERVKRTVEYVGVKSKELADVTIKKINELKDSEEFKANVKKAKDSAVDIATKAKDGAIDLTSKAINKAKEVRDSKEFQEGVDKVKEGLDKAGDKVKDLYDQAMENENIAKVVNTVSEKAAQAYETVKTNIDEYMARPDVQEKIDNAKKTTVDTLQKGVDSLRAWLYPDNDGSEKDDQ